MKRFLFIIFCLVAVNAQATVYYVDPTSSTSCGESGVTRFTDFDRDWSGLSPGDKILILEGTSHQISDVTSIPAGENGNPITVNAYSESGCTEWTAGQAGTKPILDADSTDTSEGIVLRNGYITIQNIHFTDFNAAIRVRPITDSADIYNPIFQYNQITRGIMGIRVLEDGDTPGDMYNGQILYNTIDLDGSQETEDDCIDLFSNTLNNGLISGWTIAYNDVSNCPHFGVYVSGTNNIVEYNIVRDSNNCGDGCVELASVAGSGVSDSQIARYNYCDNTGIIQIYGCTDCEVHHNVLDCSGENGCEHLGGGTVAIDSLIQGAEDSTNLLVYNNTLINIPVDFSGLRVSASGEDTGSVAGTVFANNIIYGTNEATDGQCFWVYDTVSGINPLTDVFFTNNVCTNWNGNIADIEESNYATVALFDAADGVVNANNNEDFDPQLSNISGGEFWPSSTSSNVWQAGYNTGTSYDDYIVEKDINDWPISASDLQQEDTHHIGAFTLETSSTATNSGVSINQ